jgi:two-component system phosphate regulon sensor histidine kinase PhoR
MSVYLIAIGFTMLFLLLWYNLYLRSQLEQAQLQLVLAENERREQRQHVEESVGLNENLMRAVDDPILVLDTRQNILIANPAAEDIWGQNLLGETLMGVTRHYELDLLARSALKSKENILDQVIHLREQTFRARAIQVEGNASFVQILVLNDITQLQTLGRARREMVANISHELRTPITNIQLLIETLLGGASEDKEALLEMLDSINSETQTLAQLAQEMQDLSLIESGQMPIKLTPTSLKSIVKGSVKPLKQITKRKKQTVNTDYPKDAYVLADLLPVQRALKNIIHNAVKFTPENGTIEVRACIQDDEVLITVSDDGPGIPREDLKRIFERFFQSDRSRKDGTGLGLAIARHIIKAHGGRLWAESIEGQGATFHMSLAYVPEAELDPIQAVHESED